MIVNYYDLTYFTCVLFLYLRSYFYISNWSRVAALFTIQLGAKKFLQARKVTPLLNIKTNNDSRN